MEIGLNLGGMLLRLREPKGLACDFWPTPGYKPFVTEPGSPGDIDLEILVSKSLPNLRHGRLLFDAGHGLWRLYEGPQGGVLETLSPKSKKLFSRSLISPDYGRIKVFCLPMHRRKQKEIFWSPCDILNPVGEICLLTRLARQGGLLLHAGGVRLDGKGYVFAGPSGAGKSTLSGLFEQRGALVLNDERVIIRRRDFHFVVYGTPWFGSLRAARNAWAQPAGFFLIRHGSGSNRLEMLSPAQAQGLILKACFLPLWDRPAMEKTVETAGKLSEMTREFAFLNDSSAVEYLLTEALTVPCEPVA